MTDEIAKEIVNELRLIREELQNLTMAIWSKASNFENYAGKSRKSIQPRAPYPCTLSPLRVLFERPQFGDRCFLVGISHGEVALAPFNLGRGMNDAIPGLSNLTRCSAAKGILK